MSYLSDNPITKEKLSARDLDDADMCPHCEVDHSQISHISRESDGIYLSCNDCREEYLKYARMICDDCLESFPINEVLPYRPYGFNPSDGDEELQLCDTCATQPLHMERLAADRRMAAWDESGEEDMS